MNSQDWFPLGLTGEISLQSKGLSKSSPIPQFKSINSSELNIQKTKIMASGPITSQQIDGDTVADFIFGASKSLQMMTVAMKLKDAYSLEEKLWPT